MEISEINDELSSVTYSIAYDDDSSKRQKLYSDHASGKVKLAKVINDCCEWIESLNENK